jgi:hypothetical protein
LPDKHAGFDRFAKPNLVREQIALHGILEDSSHYLDLVCFKFDRRRKQGRHSHRSCALAGLRSDECAPAIGKARALVDPVGEKLRRIFYGASPAHKRRRSFQVLHLPIRKLNELAVAMIVK